MTTSTFSLVISPPLFRRDMRHIGDAQRLVAFHRSIDDVDRIGAKHGIDDGTRPPAPALDLVLPHQIDELPLIGRRQLGEIRSRGLAACVIDGRDDGAIEFRKRRTEVEDAGLQKRFVRRHRKLLIDEVRDPRFARLRHQGLAERLEGFALMGIEQPERNAAGSCLSGRHEDLGAKPNCPADLPEDIANQIAAIARTAWSVVGGEGYGRCDFRIDQSGRPWLLEVNANPDISPTAGLARMAGVAALSFSDLIRKICDQALAKRGENYQERWVKTLRLSGLG